MKEQSTERGPESRPAWESLEALARQGVQRLLQQLLEDEVEEVLGRRRYERRNGVDAPPGYRNGWGKPRRLSAMAGTITIRRPRVRGLEARFESRLLPLFKRRTEAVGRLLPELYLHGLAQGDFDLALRGLLGAAGPGRPWTKPRSVSETSSGMASCRMSRPPNDRAGSEAAACATAATWSSGRRTSSTMSSCRTAGRCASISTVPACGRSCGWRYPNSAPRAWPGWVGRPLL